MISDDLNQQKKLSKLETKNFERLGNWDDADPLVKGISSDSNYIRPGFIFFAIEGSICHGAKFVGDAIDRGAILVITDKEGFKILQKESAKIPVIIVKNPRKKLAEYAASWNEIQAKTQIAITGTNGKTSVCDFARQIWQLLGEKAASIGTLGVQGDLQLELKNTTPDPLLLHKILKKLAQNNVEYVSMEASSHGLDQFRLDGVILKAAAYTNLSRDHLDYHSNEDDYFVSKCTLFDRVLSVGQIVVLNIDDTYASVVKLVSEERGHKVTQVGRHKNADVRICNQWFDSKGQTLKFCYKGEERVIDLALIGDFQAMNVLIAASLVIELGKMTSEVFDVLPMLTSVPGRMELAGEKGNTAKIYIDYAHTPQALESALKALRPHTIGTLMVVFGAGGERDIGKRPQMGTIAYEYADTIFITDDNPRNEAPEKIRRAIMSSCPTAIEIPDRAAAILKAIDKLQQGDVLLIAGKGHETEQIIGDDILPFNDKEFVSMSISALKGNKV